MELNTETDSSKNTPGEHPATFANFRATPDRWAAALGRWFPSAAERQSGFQRIVWAEVPRGPVEACAWHCS
jgi:hypothetical protein